MAGEEKDTIRISGLVFPQVEPGLYQVAPGTVITKDALVDALSRFHQERPWEPVEALMIEALDSDCNPMKPEGHLEPGEEQRYGCTVIGFDLDDVEGCKSIIDVTTDNRDTDEALARLIVAGLQLLHQGGKQKVITDVLMERQRQDNQWGGPQHDDTHITADFLYWINNNAAMARHLADPEAKRQALIKIAALAIAATESIDHKKTKEEPHGK